jgi:peptidoglycan/LPS O-acetylase OafA/YrhL
MSAADRGLHPKDVFPALDTVRIVGAVCVLTTHTAFWAGSYTHNQLVGPFLARMDVGVALFFVLSGFLLFRPWLVRSQLGLRSPSLPDYYVRRVFRIFPVYLVAAVLALALVRENVDLTVGEWVSTLALLDIYVGDGPPHGLTHTWSLATELAFYAVLPLLGVLAVWRSERVRARRVLVVLAGAAVVNVAWTLGARDLVRVDAATPLNEWLPGLLLWFAGGMALAQVDVMSRSATPLPRWAAALMGLARMPGVCWMLAFALVVIASTPVAGPTMFAAPSPGEVMTKVVLYTFVGVLVVATGVFPRSGSAYEGAMSAAFPRHLGHISYGVFCIHIPVLHLIMWGTGYQLFGGHFLELWLIALVSSVVAAELLYRWVELPGMRAGRRVAALTRQKVTAPTTTR